MVTDQQVRRLFVLMHQEPMLAMAAAAAAKAGMDEKTARKYRRLGKLPSEVKPDHTWRTRKDPFADVWHEVRRKLKINMRIYTEADRAYIVEVYRGPGHSAQAITRPAARDLLRRCIASLE